MAEEHDPKLSEHYRSLEPLEPPPELDRTILAAARDASDKPHAPLVVPAGRHRWYYSLAAAAVLVFAVALTLHIERERPDPEGNVASTAPAPQLRLERELRGVIKRAPEPESQPAAKPEAFAPEPQPQAQEAKKPSEAPAAPPPAPRRAAADEVRARQDAALERAKVEAERARMQLERRTSNPDANSIQQRAAPAAAPTGGLAIAGAPENPERWLERIAELRSRGKHAEADKALAEFRRAYPDYRLSEVMRERVEGK